MPRSLARGRSLFALGRTRWSADEARVVLERLDASKLSVSDFAAREGIDPQRLYRWRAQLNGRRSERTAFVEILPAGARSWIEVVSPSGHVIRVPETFSEDALRRVLAVVDERTSRC